MELTYNYSLKEQDFIHYTELIYSKVYPEWRTRHYWNTAQWLALLGMAALFAHDRNAIFFMCVFLAYMLFTIYGAVPYHRAFRRSLNNNPGVTKQRSGQLHVDDHGLTEDLEAGIELSAPWRSAVGFTRFRDKVFIELVGNQWIFVPETALSAESSPIESLLQALREHGVPEREAPRPIFKN